MTDHLIEIRNKDGLDGLANNTLEPFEMVPGQIQKIIHKAVMFLMLRHTQLVPAGAYDLQCTQIQAKVGGPYEPLSLSGCQIVSGIRVPHEELDSEPAYQMLALFLNSKESPFIFEAGTI